MDPPLPPPIQHPDPCQLDRKLFLRLRLRIDGRLQTLLTPPKQLFLPVISRFKVMSDLDITMKRVPQDGRISIRYQGGLVDFRVSTLPTIFGEKCVAGLEATGRGPELLQSGLMLATALAPVVGYEQAAKIAKAAHASGRTVLEEALELTDLPEQELRKLLDPAGMVAPVG